MRAEHSTQAGSSAIHAKGKHLLGAKEAAKRDPARRDLILAQQALLSGQPGAAERAVMLYRQAAEHGSAIAEYDLGFCHESGLGVPVDLGQAATWYRRAAANKSDPAVQHIASSSLSALAEAPSLATP